MKQFSQRILILLLLSLPFNIISQVGTIKIEKPKSEKPTIDTSKITVSFFDVFYGYKFFANDFQDRFNTTKKFKFNKPVQFIGAGVSDPVAFNRESGRYYVHSLFRVVIPQSVFLNDSIKCKVTGFMYSLAWGGFLYSKSEKFFTGFYLGFNTGRLRFYGNETVRQKNPFFSPKIGIQSKVLIRKLTIGFLVEADYDISKTSWRRLTYTNKNKIDIDRFRQTGITALFSISYHFIKYATDNTTIDGDGDF